MITLRNCIGETRFFREKRTFDTLKFLIESLNISRFEIWSSACATGEEAYSIAILLYEMGFNSDDVKVFATDINESFLKKAKKGIYSSKDMEKSERSDIYRYFNNIDNKYYEIANYIREYVQFSYFDLTNFSAYTNLKNQFRFVFLRNVLIYFHIDMAREVLSNTFITLEDNGCLFLGNKEVLYECFEPKKFKKVIFNDTVYYIKLKLNKRNSSKNKINNKDSKDIKKEEKPDLNEFLFYINSNNIKDACRILQKMDKNSFEYFFAKGMIEELRGHEEIAEKLYKKAIEIEPEFPLSHLYLGNIYYNKKDYLNTYREYIYAIEGLKEVRSGKWRGFIKEDDIEFMENFLKSRVGI